MSIAASTVVPLPLIATVLVGGAFVMTYTSKADFLAAGWAVEYWIGGVKQTSPVWSFVVVNAATGRYDLTVTAIVGQGEIQIYPPAGITCNVQGYTLDVEQNNLDGIESTLLSTTGLPSSSSTSATTTGALGTMVSGDSYQSPTLTIPLTAFQALFSQTDLSGITIEAAAATDANATPINLPTPTIVNSASRIISLSWPLQTLLLAAGVSSQNYQIDVQCIKPGAPNKILTVFQLSITVVWQSDVRVA